MKIGLAVATVITSLAATGWWQSSQPLASSGIAIAEPRRVVAELPAEAFDACAGSRLGAACSFDSAERTREGTCAQSSTAGLFCFRAPDGSRQSLR
jgi:hypothetical protein